MRIKDKVKNSEIIKRLIAETPEFWKKVRTVFMSIGASALTLWLANRELELNLSEGTIEVLKHILVSSILITGTAQLTKKDSDEDKINQDI